MTFIFLFKFFFKPADFTAIPVNLLFNFTLSFLRQVTIPLTGLIIAVISDISKIFYFRIFFRRLPDL